MKLRLTQFNFNWNCLLELSLATKQRKIARTFRHKYGGKQKVSRRLAVGKQEVSSNNFINDPILTKNLICL